MVYLGLGEYQLHSGFFQSLFKELLNIAIHCSFAVDPPAGTRSTVVVSYQRRLGSRMPLPGKSDDTSYTDKNPHVIRVARRASNPTTTTAAPPPAAALSLKNIKKNKK